MKIKIIKQRKKNKLLVANLIVIISLSCTVYAVKSNVDVDENCCGYLSNPSGNTCVTDFCKKDGKVGICVSSIKTGLSKEDLLYSCNCLKGTGNCGNGIKEAGEECDYVAIPNGCADIQQGCDDTCKCAEKRIDNCIAYTTNKQCIANGGNDQPCFKELNNCPFYGICGNDLDSGECSCKTPDYIYPDLDTGCVAVIVSKSKTDGSTQQEECACPEQGCTMRYINLETGVEESEPGVCYAYPASDSDPKKCHCIPADHCGDKDMQINYGEECDPPTSTTEGYVPDSTCSQDLEPSYCGSSCRCVGICSQFFGKKLDCEKATCSLDGKECVYNEDSTCSCGAKGIIDL